MPGEESAAPVLRSKMNKGKQSGDDVPPPPMPPMEPEGGNPFGGPINDVPF